jgi:phosphatidylglycerophosphate synthase
MAFDNDSNTAKSSVPSNYVVDSNILDPLRDVTLPLCDYLVTKTPLYVSPNIITTFGMFSFFASFLVSFHTHMASPSGVAARGYHAAVIAHLCMAFGLFIQHIADDLDGIVARARGQCSFRGEFLDHAGDRLVFLLLYWSGLVAIDASPYMIVCIVSVEGFTGYLKLCSTHMILDSSGEWLRYGAALHHLLSAFVSLCCPHGWIWAILCGVFYVFYAGMAVRQLHFQLVNNVNLPHLLSIQFGIAALLTIAYVAICMLLVSVSLSSESTKHIFRYGSLCMTVMWSHMHMHMAHAIVFKHGAAAKSKSHNDNVIEDLAWLDRIIAVQMWIVLLYVVIGFICITFGVLKWHWITNSVWQQLLAYAFAGYILMFLYGFTTVAILIDHCIGSNTKSAQLNSSQPIHKQQ